MSEKELDADGDYQDVQFENIKWWCFIVKSGIDYGELLLKCRCLIGPALAVGVYNVEV